METNVQSAWMQRESPAPKQSKAKAFGAFEKVEESQDEGNQDEEIEDEENQDEEEANTERL